jgi:hypothetical protein
MHLLIPFACSDAPGCTAQLPTLRLPHLDTLLQRMVLVDSDQAPADSLSTPHERARARLLGLTAADGCIPWAAREARAAGLGQPGDAWAWVAPVHWDVGAQSIVMADPRTLALDEPDARDLMAAMAPYFAEDAMPLHYVAPHRWLCRGDIFRALPSAALDRVAGRDIQPWMPAAPALRRLQNEMQMLLYTHPVNDRRVAQGRSTVNSFWVSGTGAWAEPATATQVTSLHEPDPLRDAALQGDWPAWATAWRSIDASVCRALGEALAREPDSRLILCGERGALTFAPGPSGLWQQLRRHFTTTTLASLQDRL